MSEPSTITLPGRIRSLRFWLSNGTAQAELPEKIRSAISDQQDSSERLIGWIQLAILMVFALLYLAAPNTLPREAEFEPVPFFLGAYFVFTCIRVYLAHKTRLGFWMPVLSVLVDMGLLIGLIWSFHVQYMQPPSFYLKSPTLLYIFIFIALRALRFEPGFVLFSGIVGAVGWLFLVWFAISTDAEMSVITRDYVLYLTSNMVLLGGEIDKIISILMVAIILTLAIARARRLLIRSIVEGTTAENLSHFVPESVAAQIAHADGPLIETKPETEEASILFVDLTSFTTLAERLSPEKLIVTLNEYFSVISEPIERNHGVINQFQGDAILASFNLPTRDADHASSAVAAALEIERILSTHKFPEGTILSTRAGVNTGKVVGGFVGTPNRLSYTVYGDDVNIAARLQELSKKKNATNLISLRTRELCDETRFSFEPKGNEVLRGRQTSLQVFEAKFKA
ncbi:MAG: adenylate/guanylate cyclase domain-containing protein [Granulosicoccus sp.]